MSNPTGKNQYSASGGKVGSPNTRQAIAHTIRKARKLIRSSGVVPANRVNREAVAMTRRLMTSPKK